MHELPLPPHPNLEQYEKHAEDLVAAARSGDPGAVRVWASRWLNALARLLGVAIDQFVQQRLDRSIEELEQRVRDQSDGTRFTLADAQHLLAAIHGFPSWAEFAGHLERPFHGNTHGREFEAAADAVVTGDPATLQSLVGNQPDLVRAHSTQNHRATLLHYVAANGVEDWRQRTPPNAVAIAALLLESGAEVDALANTYGGGSAQTTMNLLVSSTHPAQAGLQSALVETLLGFGAVINGLMDDESPLMTALAFGYPEAAETLARRGARVDNILAAAGLGRADLVKRFVTTRGALAPGVPLVGPVWWRMPDDGKVHLELALVWASRFGRTDVIELLLQRGVDVAAKDADAMTALHQAAAGRHLDAVKLLLEQGAPLEVRNRWGGTVLSSTVYCARVGHIAHGQYAAVLETLVAAGADVDAVGPTGSQTLEDLIRRRREK